MHAMSLAQAKARLSELLNAVESGQEVVITRHGRPVARVLPAGVAKQALPLARLAKLRKRLPAREGSSADLLRELRDTE
jgi:prevent-host-death family protein